MEIRNIRLRNGTPCASVQDAVDKFRCPGPCDPDCGLYPAVRISGDKSGHMCHPDIVARYPVSVLDAMGCSYETAVGEVLGRLYAAVVRSHAVRDVQTCHGGDTDPLSANWEDEEDAEVWLGFFRDPGALEKAARYAGTVPEHIRLMPLDEADEIRPAGPGAAGIVLEDAGDAGAGCRNYAVRLPAGTTLRRFVELVRDTRKDESGTVYVSGNLAEASPSNYVSKWEYVKGMPQNGPELNQLAVDKLLDLEIRVARASGGWGRMAWYVSLVQPSGTEAGHG